jgi:hypothetical protein
VRYSVIAAMVSSRLLGVDGILYIVVLQYDTAILPFTLLIRHFAKRKIVCLTASFREWLLFFCLLLEAGIRRALGSLRQHCSSFDHSSERLVKIVKTGTPLVARVLLLVASSREDQHWSRGSKQSNSELSLEFPVLLFRFGARGSCFVVLFVVIETKGVTSKFTTTTKERGHDHYLRIDFSRPDGSGGIYCSIR